MASRKDWSQILAEGASIKIGDAQYDLAPLTAGDFGKFITAMKNRQIVAFEQAATPAVVPSQRAEVLSKIMMNTWTDTRVVEVACSLEGAPWILRQSLTKAGAKGIDALVDELPHAELIDKAAFILQLSGIVDWGAGSANPPPMEPTGEMSSES